MAFGVDGLDGSGLHTRFTSEVDKELADAADVGAVASGVEDSAIADYVVDDDDGAGAREFQSPGEIAGIILLVRVDEDQVKGHGMGGRYSGERVQGLANVDFDYVRETCMLEILAGYFGVFGIELEGDQATGGRKSAGQPDGAVSAERADFEDLLCADAARNQVQEFAERGCYGDGRKPGVEARFQNGVQYWIGRDQRGG